MDTELNIRLSSEQILKKYFGYDKFRDGQNQLIESILSGKDTLGIMPTGAGKSLCYQIPSLMMDGVALVISPLISLMKDQVLALNQAGIHAAFINSSLTYTQVLKALKLAKEYRYKIIYAAPERLETEEFMDFALHTEISMLTVDEAHCISQWGQDFRPSYLKILSFIEKLPKRPVISAFTATATDTVKEDIVKILRLNNPTTLVTGFDRENLYFEVKNPQNKYEWLFEYLSKNRGKSGIIYCATRKNVEELYEKLSTEGFLVSKYHAGMSDKARSENQDAFIYDVSPVMIATNAFGMGIDKSNVRFVVHYNMPKNMESYYQEAGRAGRDGENAECILLYAPMDIRINQFMIEGGFENDELTSLEKSLIMERDRERLQKMVLYCNTNSCLREYILDYFGETAGDCCNNCSNCLEEFEEADVTNIAVNIISCIKDSRQRFGINVIVGTLKGARLAKLKESGMFELSSYGACQNISESLIKQVINELIIRGYIYTTNDKYTVIKLDNPAKRILSGEDQVKIKLSAKKENEKDKKTNKKPYETLNSKGIDLFELLRGLRSELAQKEKVPPYVIFSDKTLTDMCVKLPFNKEEMLNVNGVGENKYEKYAKEFIELIQKFTNGERQKLYYDAALSEEGYARTGSSKVRSAKGRKSEFKLTDEMKENITITGTVLLGAFVEALNEQRDPSEMKRIAGTHITERLIKKGYIDEVYLPDKKRMQQKPTDKGTAAGIGETVKISEKGNEYTVLTYNEEAQRLLLRVVEEMTGNN